ncbi:MAG: ABC transporter substrate-binding protein [Bacteroidota bacterium]
MKILSFLLIVFFVLFSCKEDQPQTFQGEKNLVRYAKYLRIIENGKTTKIEILSPESGKVEQTFNLGKEFVKTSHFIKVPIERMTVLSSTHVGMLAVLNSINNIVGITNRQYVYNEDLLRKVENGKVLELGEEGQIPVESLLKSKCQAIIYSGFGKEFSHQKQLQAAGINCIVNYDWREIHPLGKAEWILLFGYLTGKEKQAKEYFNRIEKEYLKLKSKAEKLNESPSVISGNMYGETWFAPAGESFNAVIFKDAHVSYRYAKTEGTGSVALTMEKVLSDNLDTDFWINPGMPTKAKLFGIQPRLKYLGPVTKNPIYDYSKGGNLYWEMSAIEPQKVLSDYLSIFHPKAFPKKTLYFYQEVK